MGGFAQMFARELAADWTSWGNEVLRFQTLDRWEWVGPDHACPEAHAVM
jgi:hypothetical protein